MAGAALAFTTALVPLCVRADDTTRYAVPITLPHFVDAPRHRTVPTRTILYVLQAVDALETAAALRHPGRYEMNPSVRPFARRGIVGIALGFAAGDLLRERLFRSAPERVRDAANGLQALANLDGIVSTRRALHAP